MESGSNTHRSARGIRWWPGVVISASMAVGLVWVHAKTEWPFQERNIAVAQIVGIGGILLIAWWVFLSRVGKRSRLMIGFGVLGVLIAGGVLFRLRGVSGDLVPIFEFRWRGANALTTNSVPPPGPSTNSASFPQFYGPNRDGVLPGPALATNWTEHAPQVLWRRPVGAGWSGFAISGDLCLTQEQHGESECVVARALASGEELWRHADRAHFGNPVAGEGPRATPAIVDGRVFTFGSSGMLNCLDLATGKPLWQREVVKDSAGKVPTWGAASSPLVVEDLVIVHGGEDGTHSLFAYRLTNGAPVWKGGKAPSYASPIRATLAGVPQVVAFNDGSVSGHDLRSGATLWERRWGNGNAVCATPVIVSSNRVLFSSGYGVGSELLELVQKPDGTMTVSCVWKSTRMKSKFGHLFIRDGSVFGLDDGVFACVDLATGAQRWKEGRYGHGQGLAVGDRYLLMSERGELVLLAPDRNGPNELARLRIFNSKTWNPIALAGDLLLTRNDREAACVRLPTAESGRVAAR